MTTLAGPDIRVIACKSLRDRRLENVYGPGIGSGPREERVDYGAERIGWKQFDGLSTLGSSNRLDSRFAMDWRDCITADPDVCHG